ncbi:MAG: undecaprenyl-phosphate glucose phosphotransferase [Ignavibacteria bacterium]|nr:undecaprenyl-phosphate glucose phosphotransferase [Ignavibacteria bacterium]
MQHRKDFLIPFLTVLADVAAIEGAFLFSYWLRFYSPLTELYPVTKGFPPLSAYIIGSLFVIPAWLFLFNARRMYSSRRILYFSDEFFAIVRVVFVGMLLVMAGAFFYREFSYSRLVFALLGFNAIVLISLGRFGVMKFEQHWYARGNDTKNVVLIGSNQTAKRILERIAALPSLGYRVIGFFANSSDGSLTSADATYLGTISQASEYLRTHRIDVVMVALPSSEHQVLFDLVRQCEGLNAEIMMVPDMLEMMTSRVRIRELEGIPFIPIKDVPLSTWNQITKRVFDIAVSGLILGVASPFILLIMLLIKLTSKGPVFYHQERVGLDGTSFRVMKFRSMRIDAETTTGPVWAQKDDPRTTSVGKFLRRWSLDEIPQFINVLRGDMSIVGPRPERPHFVAQFQKEIPKYLDRHRVKTGITGWAQVNGLRGNTPIDERTKYDIYYVENWSLVLDLKIILKTIRAVFFGENAY